MKPIPQPTLNYLINLYVLSKEGEVVEVSGAQVVPGKTPEDLLEDFRHLVRQEGEYVKVEPGVLRVHLRGYGELKFIFGGEK